MKKSNRVKLTRAQKMANTDTRKTRQRRKTEHAKKFRAVSVGKSKLQRDIEASARIFELEETNRQLKQRIELAGQRKDIEKRARSLSESALASEKAKAEGLEQGLRSERIVRETGEICKRKFGALELLGSLAWVMKASLPARQRLDIFEAALNWEKSSKTARALHEGIGPWGVYQQKQMGNDLLAKTELRIVEASARRAIGEDAAETAA